MVILSYTIEWDDIKKLNPRCPLWICSLASPTRMWAWLSRLVFSRNILQDTMTIFVQPPTSAPLTRAVARAARPVDSASAMKRAWWSVVCSRLSIFCVAPYLLYRKRLYFKLWTSFLFGNISQYRSEVGSEYHFMLILSGVKTYSLPIFLQTVVNKNWTCTVVLENVKWCHMMCALHLLNCYIWKDIIIS